MDASGGHRFVVPACGRNTAFRTGRTVSASTLRHPLASCEVTAGRSGSLVAFEQVSAPTPAQADASKKKPSLNRLDLAENPRRCARFGIGSNLVGRSLQLWTRKSSRRVDGSALTLRQRFTASLAHSSSEVALTSPSQITPKQILRLWMSIGAQIRPPDRRPI